MNDWKDSFMWLLWFVALILVFALAKYLESKGLL